MDGGFEYNTNIGNDHEYYQKIVDAKSYFKKEDFNHDCHDDLMDIMVSFSLFQKSTKMKDSRNVGTAIGVSVLGIVGFFALSFTIVGGIAGGIVGLIMGRYAGKRLRRKIGKEKKITEWEFYKLKIDCMLKWLKIQKLKNKHNLNHFRLYFEKTLQALKFSILCVPYLDKKNAKCLKKRINKLKKISLSEIAISSTFLICKLYSRSRKNKLHNVITRDEEAAAFILHNVLKPLYMLHVKDNSNVKIKISSKEKSIKVRAFSKVKKIMEKLHLI